MNIAIIFAGGVGQRFGSEFDITPKQFYKINGKPILVHTLEHFQNHENIDKIYISVLKEFVQYTHDLIQQYNISKVQKVVEGGNCAMHSIFNALDCAIKENPSDSVVLIHDGVRPVINKKVIDANIESVEKYGNAITAIGCNETVVISKNGLKADDVPIRKETYKAQAPQSFRLEEVYSAHKQVESYENIVDNCTLYLKLKKQVYLVEGNFGNIKITTPEDVFVLKGILDYLQFRGEKVE